MEKPKIVHIVQSLQTGGAEMLLVNLAINCKDRFDVTVISQYKEGNFPLEKHLAEHGINTIYLDKKVGFDLRSIIELYKVLNKIKPDIVHTHLHAAIYAIPWYLTHKKTVKVHTVHSVASMELGKTHRILQGFAYRFCGVVPIAISPFVKDSIVGQNKIRARKVPIILNGIDVSKYDISNDRKNPDRPFTVINVASFSRWKNQIMLLNSFYKVTLKHPETQLVFVGEGAEKAQVETAAKKLGIYDKTIFAGLTSEVEKYLNSADIFVLSSTFEGVPLSILEAYAAGLPVISTRVGGVQDILEDGVNGFLVPSGDESAMTSAILKLIENPELRGKISDLNKLKAKEFDIKNITEQYIELYSRYGEKYEKIKSNRT